MDLVSGYRSLLTKMVEPFVKLNDKTSYLGEADLARLAEYERFWNFFLGYHFDYIATNEDSPQTTQNWCRRFVNKYVSTEFNGGFTFKFDKEFEKDIQSFVNGVWDDNNGSELMMNIGQCKSVTGDAYIHVHYESSSEINDPFGMYPKGRIRLFSIPSSIVFPKYKDGYNGSPDALESVSIIYNVEREPTLFAGKKTVTIKYIYTKDEVRKQEDGKDDVVIPNQYGIIPIVHFRNLPLSGSNFGLSDLEDVIPLNLELNAKCSDVSEILTYHAAPTTIITGARIANLERGANNVWGGLPKDAKVFNLELQGDLGASINYIGNTKTNMFEIANMPKLAIGGEAPPANLSGTAFQIAFMPLIDLIKTKQVMTGASVQLVNKIILLIGLKEGMISVKESDRFKLFTHRVVFGDILPRDMVQELSQIQQEMKAGLESRENALERLKKDSPQALLKEIDKDSKENPLYYGIAPLSMPAGNRLVNPSDGSVMLEPEKEKIPVENNANPQMDFKNKVGTNRDGKEKKLFTGLEKT